jgi:hypothetical protein
MSSGTTKSPSGGADSQHVMERHSLNPIHIVDGDSLSVYGPMTSTNRLVRAHRKCPWGRPACGVVWEVGGGDPASYPIMW